MILTIINYWKYFLHRLRIRKLKKMVALWGGSNIFILPGFKIGHADKLMLHNFVRIGEDSFLNAHGGIEICSGFVSGPRLTIFSVNHVYEPASTFPFDNSLDFRNVTIGENCWVGANVFIVPGVTLGEGCIVAGGAVVTKSFPPLSVIGGNPAQLLKMRNKEEYDKTRMGGVNMPTIYCKDLL